MISTYTLDKDHWAVGLLGHPAGEYDVQIPVYGWEVGDLYITTPKGKLFLKDLRK